MSEAGRQLCLWGIGLIGVGLLNGFVVPLVAAPRIGLSAHLAAVQGGMLLALLGLVWPSLALRGAAEVAARNLAIGSLWSIWLGIALGAAFGAARAFPIAGAGVASSASRWQEGLSAALVVGGSLASLAAIGLVLLGLWRSAR